MAEKHIIFNVASDTTGFTYPLIIARAKIDPDFRDGLLAAAAVCRAQGTNIILRPSDIAAHYLENLASGKMP